MSTPHSDFPAFCQQYLTGDTPPPLAPHQQRIIDELTDLSRRHPIKVLIPKAPTPGQRLRMTTERHIADNIFALWRSRD